MVNESGLQPLGRAVLVQMVELEEMKAKTIHIPDSVRRGSAAMEQKCIVVAVGAAAWEDEKEPRCISGDKVIITKMAGFIAKGADGKVYRLVNDRDIFCKITKEGAENG